MQSSAVRRVNVPINVVSLMNSIIISKLRVGVLRACTMASCGRMQSAFFKGFRLRFHKKHPSLSLCSALCGQKVCAGGSF